MKNRAQKLKLVRSEQAQVGTVLACRRKWGRFWLVPLSVAS